MLKSIVLLWKEIILLMNRCEEARDYQKKTFTWIMENRFIEVGTLELIADAIGCSLQDIAAEDSTGSSENVIEWVRDAKTALVTLTQWRYISRVRQLAADRPNECRVLTEKADGSICARIPISWVKISPPREVSEEQRERAKDLVTFRRSK